MTAFDLSGPLPRGSRVVLQASAGTGKTHAIATLAARYVAEGDRLEDLMVVTFSTASTRELRSRIRMRIAELAATVATRLAGDASEPSDPAWAPVLASTDLPTVASRLTSALASFDRAMICTTHQFCDRMLAELGVLADHEPSSVLARDVTDLTDQVVDDAYLRAYARDDQPAFDLDVARKIGRRAVDDIALPLIDIEDRLAAERVSLARTVREEVEIRKRRLNVYTFDDMQVRLLAALRDPTTGQQARARIRRRFPVVLVDEFQDTDPVQWQIVKAVFDESSTVVLIGDPKQSIYGFRGADVTAYLEATAEAERYDLVTNWRSTPELVRAVSVIFDGARLGDPRITVDPVTAGDRPVKLVAPGPWQHAVRFRTSGRQRARSFAQQVNHDVSADIAALLVSRAQIDRAGVHSPLTAGDIAVLVNSNSRGQRILRLLAEHGIPATFTGAESVFASDAAQDWVKLLDAIAQPRTGRVRAACLTPMLGWSLSRLAQAGDDERAALSQSIRHWGRVLDRHGPVGLVEVLLAEGLAERLLATRGGDRHLTDIRHLAELLEDRRRDAGSDAASLAGWLRERAQRATAQTDDRSRRLETDDQVVRILTIHQAKGLEFPVVYLPDVSARFPRSLRDEPLQLHETRDGTTTRSLDVGGRAPGRESRERAYRSEDDGESLRTLYVALTRAQAHITAWWAWTEAADVAALSRVLLRPEGPDVPARVTGRVTDLRDVPRLAQADIVVESMTTEVRLQPPTRPPMIVAPAVAFTRDIDLDWRRTSFSALSAPAHEAYVADLGGELAGDEPALPEDAFPPEAGDAVPTTGDGGAPVALPGMDEPSPMADLPGGVAFGSLVHAVFEGYDPTSVGSDLDAIVARQLSRMPVADVSAADLVTALRPALATSLGPLAPGTTLSDIAPADRLAELDFELPLGRGSEGATTQSIARLLERWVRPDDLLAPYADRLANGGLDDRPLRGYLTGSIDAVLRIDQRYVVVDYKTNRLAPASVPLRIGHYTPSAMAEAMMASHYPLQALLYSVALHRMLRWRMPAYDPEVALGGIGYLFVRGMAGPATPVVDGMPCGVFVWRPAAGLVTDLSELLGGAP